MKNKDCKIVCDGKEVATIECSNGSFQIKSTKEGKEMMKELCNCNC